MTQRYTLLDRGLGVIDEVVSLIKGKGFVHNIFEGILSKEAKLIQSKYKGLVHISSMMDTLLIETTGRNIKFEFDLIRGTIQLSRFSNESRSGLCMGPSIILHDVPKIYNKRVLSEYIHHLFNDISSLLINGAVCDSSKRFIETIYNGVTYLNRDIWITFDVEGDEITVKIAKYRGTDNVCTVIKPKSWVTDSNIREFIDTYNKQLDFWDQYDDEWSKVMYDLDDKLSRLQEGIVSKIRGL